MKEEKAIQPYRHGVLDGIRKLSAVVGNSKPPEPDGDLDIRYVVRVLLARYRDILKVAIAATMVALIVSLFIKPVYRAEATIEIKESTPDIESLQQLQSHNPVPSDVVMTEVETEIGILKSDTLARRVIDQLHLGDEQHKSFSITGIVKRGFLAVTHWYSGSGEETHAELDDKAYQRLVNQFESSLSVFRVGSSRLVNVSYESGDPRLSANIVNAVVTNYLDMHQATTDRLTKMLGQQVQEAKDDLEKSETQMSEYARKNGLLYLETDNGTSQNIINQRLRQIQDQLTQAQADRFQKQSVYQLVQKGDYGSLPGVFQDKLLQSLTEQVTDLKRQYAQLSATFTDSYPKVQQVKSQLNAVEKVLEQERARAAASITDDYLASVRREALLVREFNQQKASANAVAEKSNQYGLLKRNAESDNQLYDNILQKVKEASLVARIKANNVDVVDRAEPEFLPVKPKILLNLALGFMLGLGLGIGIAFLQEYLDTSLKSVEEIDHFLGLPALAMIPSVDSLLEMVADGNGHGENGLMLPDVFDKSALMKTESPWYRIDRQIHQKYSPLVEAFRTLGSSVMLESAGHKRMLRSIVITSSQPGEGKTTVAVNLALALSEQGKRVILIDADLRRPSVHRALGFRNIRGLAGYLGGMNDWAPCVLPGLTPNLDTLPAGKSSQSPVALLSSVRMKTLISQALEEYDYVIVDSPALMPNLADARILAELVDGSIMVVRSGMAPREFVIRARRHLTNVVGVVLNSMDVRSMEDYYGYHTYGYGADEKSEEKTEATPFEKRIAG